MRKNHYIIVLDVEGMSSAKPYNIGYIIGDRKGNIVQQRSYALPNNFWENLQNCLPAREMTHKNLQEILADFGAGDERKYNYISNCDFIEQFNKDIEEYKISQVWAYNCIFDNGAIRRLYDLIPLPEVEWCDIWSAIAASCLYNKKYVKWCLKNNFVTDKGNIKSSAEVVYAYLTNNVAFCEEHTALADVWIEYEILLKVFKSKKKLEKKQKKAIWKILGEIRDNI